MSDCSDSYYDDNGICEECNQPKTSRNWCKECNAKWFQENFKNWTSGNDNIDKFIQNAQLSATEYRKVLEWIPHDRFYDINYIAKGGFGIVYKAKWIDGFIINWDNKNKNWKRHNQNMEVALKSLNNSKNILEFINEITLHYKLCDTICPIIPFCGITQDPETKNYMMVLFYADHGSLRNYLNSNKNESYSWKNKFTDLYFIASGLDTVHKKDLIHRDLHIGNILKMTHYCNITDMGLCKPEDYKDNNTKKGIYGVLPYVAPEILRYQNYTKASDIYSFGIIMYEVFSELPPYYDISHNENLAIKICHGLRPRFNIKVPELIINLIKRCLDANPLNRPTAEELKNILSQWRSELIRRQTELTKQVEEADEISKNLQSWDANLNLTTAEVNISSQWRSELIRDDRQTELTKQVEEADEINKNLQNSDSSLSTSSGLSYETHSEAIYTSRLLNFNNLPKPKNSDDYYEQNDNIISTKFSESLRIDISQLMEN